MESLSIAATEPALCLRTLPVRVAWTACLQRTGPDGTGRAKGFAEASGRVGQGASGPINLSGPGLGRRRSYAFDGGSSSCIAQVGPQPACAGLCPTNGKEAREAWAGQSHMGM
jgi:hypothetical protein